ncbi:hypothetical protein C8A00DRAFT_17560 [Chaetomidium leptoderma]|uniref:Uncharacterized protein n=1 Tax=Chaetomidium leptoderma TaxID=669021 RepID=A0AAN6VIV2_9PEZI|nr:hypothetical protein C8A00DRAFT_17560 [Chaetomidium leptoderma]
MQRSAATPTQTAAPFFSSLFGGGGGGTSSNANKPPNPPPSPTSNPQRPTTSSGDNIAGGSPRQQKVLLKDRKPSFGRKASFIFSSSSSPGKRDRRRADSASSNTGPPADGGGTTGPTLTHRPSATQLFSDSTGLSLPDPSPKTSDGFSKMLSRGAVTPISGYPVAMNGPGSMLSGSAQQSEQGVVHQHILETANKRISTLDYLRKAHEGRIYWFNTLLFDKPDLQRMPYFDARKLGRRATNYLLLGISLPAVIDLNSSTPLEFLRTLNTLLAEFDAFQQIHTETGIAATSLTRTRIPQMFRRAAAPVSKGRRSSSAAGRDAAAAAAASDMGIGGYALEQVDSNTAGAGATGATGPTTGGGGGGGGGGSSSAAAQQPQPPPPQTSGDGGPPAGVMAFGASEVDLLPGEEYTYLLTPTLPFDPDFFETFATLCDVLIDTYTRLLSLVPTPRECNGTVAELFTKADSKIRKLFIQAVIREFEENGRAGVKSEVANVGKVVLSGLM